MTNNDHQLDDFFGIKTSDANTAPKERIKEILVKKGSWFDRLRLLPKILSTRERYTVGIMLILIVGALLSLPFTSYYHFTVASPNYGGTLKESILGEPHFVNPLLAQTNDADRDLVSLVYSGLLKHNSEGKLVPDLAKSYEVSSDGLTYTVYLRDNALWHDNQPVTSDDVVFTINTIKNADFASPLRASWQGVEIEKGDDHTVLFKLKNKYAQFLNNLTLGILPQHLWQDIKPVNFSLSELNTKPVGSGPYQFKKLRKDQYGRIVYYEFSSNRQFYEGRPYIDTVAISFYNSEDEMIDAYNNGTVQSMSISAQNIKKLKYKNSLTVHKVKLPRYFASFFNQTRSKALADRNVRLALTQATDRNDLIKTILDGNGISVQSPMIPGILTDSTSAKQYTYDPTQAQQVLEAGGWKVGSDGIRTKGADRLSVKITTSTWPELTQVAEKLKEQWNKVGVEVTIDSLPISQLQQTIKERNYQILLFGEILNIDPDPFSLWHSSQKHEPGLNLALYDNKTVDTLLEDARQTINPLERAQKYDDFQKILAEDLPALFLYSPYYLYVQNKDIRGFDTSIISMPSERFSQIESWYINTQRSSK